MRQVLLASALALFCSAALADVPVEAWNVSSKPDADGDCNATKVTTDPGDGGTKKAVVTSVVGEGTPLDAIILSVSYGKWKLDKGKFNADLRIDGRTVAPNQEWQSSGAAATAIFSNAKAMLPILSGGSRLLVRVEGRDMEFDISGLGMAMGAVAYCQRRK